MPEQPPQPPEQPKQPPEPKPRLVPPIHSERGLDPVPWGPRALNRAARHVSNDTIPETLRAEESLKRTTFGVTGAVLGGLLYGTSELIATVAEHGSEAEAAEVVPTIEFIQTGSLAIMGLGAVMASFWYLRARGHVRNAWRIRDEAIERELRPPKSGPVDPPKNPSTED